TGLGAAAGNARPAFLYGRSCSKRVSAASRRRVSVDLSLLSGSGYLGRQQQSQSQSQHGGEAKETKGSRGSGGSASGQQQQHRQQRQDSDADGEARQRSDGKEDEPLDDKDDAANNNSDNAGDDEDTDQEEEGGDDNDEEDGQEEDDDEEEEDEDDGVVRCVCGERNDGELMIQCEICQVWQHTLCMGIRDEAHIPDKYYCEKCRPEDHPYINSRPRTVVLAEASMMGTSTMMRRSAVMAVAKMSAREEYRAASAAAAIAASVAAAATGISLPNGGSAGGKKTPKKQAKKNDASVAGNSSASTPKPGRNGRRSRRSTRGGADNDGAEASEDDYAFASKGGNNNNNGESSANSSAASGGSRSAGGEGRSGSAKPSQSGVRKNQTPKRSTLPAGAAGAAGQANGSLKRRRVTMPENVLRGGAAKSANSLNADGQDGEGDGDSDGDSEDEEKEGKDKGGEQGVAPGGFAQDLASRMLEVKQERKKKGKSSRTSESRLRSVSSVAKDTASRGSSQFDVAESLRSPRRRTAGGSSKSMGDFGMGTSDARRGHSVPGSPHRRSSSPSLHSLLYGDAAPGDGNSDANGGIGKADKPGKRKRGGTAARASKQQRMAVSATSSPFIGDGNGFGTFGAERGLSFQQQRNRAASTAGVFAADKDAGESGDDGGRNRDDNDQSGDEKSDSQGAPRQPKHNFPPREMEDVDGNKIVVPSHMLNSHGQPMYSSVSAETMCKIRYPHSKASLYDLNRRAKQLLEWLGKTQSEYEHERLSWLSPLRANESTEHSAELDTEIEARAEAAAAEENVCDGDGDGDGLGLGASFGGASVEKRSNTNQISEAPTSPISPSDWPTDDVAVDGGSDPKLDSDAGDEVLAGNGDSTVAAAAVGEGGAKPSHPRSTQSIMEDLVCRLIRFQEAYSN
ncbi:Histone deacetylase complex subunit, partial [Coemansia sp. RSA 2599]